MLVVALLSAPSISQKGGGNFAAGELVDVSCAVAFPQIATLSSRGCRLCQASAGFRAIGANALSQGQGERVLPANVYMYSGKTHAVIFD